ncbi:Ada metal-binding domain-containing protein [uncultured Selenomonas sp.]|uniref:Ada metal-binding domain-containing protein n=1 Tax=uncultured Selenomonas sp. TaxID=159275 RepID=UPI003439154C
MCQTRDKRYHDVFFLAVKSTRIVCHPDCPSRAPLERVSRISSLFCERVREKVRNTCISNMTRRQQTI